LKTYANAMKEIIEAWNRVDRNKVAIAMSVIPGMGHLYKHHYLAGFSILTIGNVLVAFISALLFFATLGFSVIVIPALWIACVACAAYMATDEHGHHPWLHVWNWHWADFVQRFKRA
jgi:hypothetical protein